MSRTARRFINLFLLTSVGLSGVLGCKACSKDENESGTDAGTAVRFALIDDDELGMELQLSEKWTPSMDPALPSTTIVDARFVAPLPGLSVRPRLVVTKNQAKDPSGPPLNLLVDRTVDATKASLRAPGVKIRRISTKSWKIDGLDVASFELGYVVTHPRSEKQSQVTQRTLLTVRRVAGKAFVVDLTATFVDKVDQSIGDEIENVFKSLKFRPVN